MKFDEPIVEDPAHDKADSQVDGGVDDALAQFVQMLHQAHAREFGALVTRCSRLADCFRGINHAGSVPPPGRSIGSVVAPECGVLYPAECRRWSGLCAAVSR